MGKSFPNEPTVKFLHCLKEEGFKRIRVNEDFIISYTSDMDIDHFKDFVNTIITKNKITVIISYTKLPMDFKTELESKVEFLTGNKNQSFEFFIQILKLWNYI